MNGLLIKMYPYLYYAFGVSLLVLFLFRPTFLMVYQDFYGYTEFQAFEKYSSVYPVIFILIQIVTILTFCLSIILINSSEDYGYTIPIIFLSISSLVLLLLIFYIFAIITGGRAPSGMLG